MTLGPRARLLALVPEERTLGRELPRDVLRDDFTQRAEERPLLPPLLREMRVPLLPRWLAARSLDPCA